MKAGRGMFRCKFLHPFPPEFRPLRQNTRTMNWILLVIAGLFEVGFTFCLEKVKGQTGMAMMGWYGAFAICLVISMLLMMKAIQTLPIGTAYAVWTGIGAVGSVIMGIVVFNEPATFWRLFFITTLISSIIGLKLVSH